MGFLDKVGDKIGATVDGGKLQVEIDKEKSKIRDANKEIAKKVVTLLDEGKPLDGDADIKEQYELILVSRKKIEELEKGQEAAKATIRE